LSSYDPQAPLSDKLSRVRKLVVSLVGGAFGIGYFIATGDPSVEEVFGAVLGYVVANYGIWRTPNAE
jgi:hypothetical protein